VTPTLAGRWQTRTFLLAVVGVPVCYLYGRAWGDIQTALTMLAYVLVLGLVWDVVYQVIQSYRWDHDWPAYIQIGACVWEAGLLWLVLGADAAWGAAGLDGAPGVASIDFERFALHFGTVWLLMFATAQGPVKLLFPKWRFSGGRFI
jgi:hypothetical protein